MQFVFFNTISKQISKGKQHVKYIWLNDDCNAIKSINYIINNYPDSIEHVFIEDIFLIGMPANSLDITNYTAIKSKDLVIDHHNATSVAFFASNDTIASSFVKILDVLDTHKVTNYIPATKDEHAANVFNDHGYEYVKFSIYHLVKNRPDYIVLANDWASEERFVILLARLLNIKSFCLQESIIDFGDKTVSRMKWADFVFIQGAHTVLELERQLYFVTGNPRYDAISFKSIPEPPKTLINCNFTYGIFEEQRDKWLSDITDILDSNNIGYIISQHPRDNGELSKFRNVVRSNSSIVHNQLQECSFVITRFSSLIHEAMCMGRKVIYYNPHNEQLKYDFEPDGVALFYVQSQDSLKQAIEQVLFQHNDNNLKTISDYIHIHCKNTISPASQSFKKTFDDVTILCKLTKDHEKHYVRTCFNLIKTIIKNVLYGK